MEEVFKLLTLVLTNFGIVWYFRKESREDWKRSDDQMKSFQEKFHEETKDFHRRLCEIEANRKKC